MGINRLVKYGVIIGVGTFILFTQVSFTSAAPDKKPIYATIEYVQGLISDAVDNIQSVLYSHEDRLESLEARMTNIEALLTPTPSPTVIPTPTPHVLLDENFNGSELNTDMWEVSPNLGRYSISDGFLVIDGGQQPGMPFFRAKNNPFPSSGGFEMEIGIQYVNIFPAGTGVGLSYTKQENASVQQFWENTPVYLWQDNGANGLNIARYTVPMFKLGYLDSSYHVVKFIYDGSKYDAYFDGELKYSTPTDTIAGGLWFGHPYYSDLPGWTDFKLDYIKIIN